MADPARKLADALEEYRTNLGMGRRDMNAADIQELFDIKNSPTYAARTIVDPAHAHTLTYISPRAIMEDLQQRTDELLHAIDLARTTITGAIPLQTLDLVRPKVKDVLANLAGTIEKDMKP